MLSFINFLAHTSLLVLSYIFPHLIGLFLIASVIFILYAYFRRRIFFLYRFGFYKDLTVILPLLIFAVIAINSSVGHFFLWLLYAFIIFFEYLLPTIKYLITRLNFYFHVKRLVKRCGYLSDINFLKIIFLGARTPYHVFVKTPQSRVTIGILGSVSAIRYIFGRSTVISQKFGNGKAYMIENIREIERFEEDTDSLFPRLGPSFLGRKHQRDIAEIKDSDKIILLIHPNSYVQENEQILGLGETIGKYRLVSIKTVFNILGE